MKRRSAIRNVVIISAGASLLPSCLQKDKGGSLHLKNISLTSSDQDIVAGLAETIIPTTNNFIGSREIKAHEFVLTMVDDCFKPEEQKNFADGLRSFEKLCKDRYHKSFTNLTGEQKKQLLTLIEAKKDIPEDVVKFYGAIKGLTLQAFTTSKQYLTDVKHFKLVPGSNFKGCVPIKKG